MDFLNIHKRYASLRPIERLQEMQKTIIILQYTANRHKKQHKRKLFTRLSPFGPERANNVIRGRAGISLVKANNTLYKERSRCNIIDAAAA